MIYYHQRLFMPRVEAARTAQGLGNGYSFGNDFYQVWLTSRQWLQQGRDPYRPERMLCGFSSPWMGAMERVNVYGSMLWVLMLAVMLLRGQKHKR